MSRFFEKIVRPVLFRLDAERAHEIGMMVLRSGLGGHISEEQASLNETLGAIERFGLKFSNPLGIAAGFDKNGIVVNQLARLGFGFVEVGTVTYESQPGNPKPRLFRLPEDRALINRLGFNNEGSEKVAERLAKIKRQCVVGVNIGKNGDVPNEFAVQNYVNTLDLIHPVADYIAVNVSSPNTPNLRDLQAAENLELLLGSLKERNIQLGPKPLLVKIAPDLDESEIESIVDLCLRMMISGIIATNTTVSRNALSTSNVEELGSGGLSGKPLAARSNKVIEKIYRHSGGKLPIVGVGGIFTPQDAFEKIASGASLIQAYTGFIYRGPSFAVDVLSGLSSILKERGFSTLDEAVGSGVKRV